MNMGSRKVNTEGIDEELLIASIGRRKQDGTLYRAQEPPAPAPRRRKRSRIGTAVRTVTGKGETAERQRTPQTAGGRLHRTVPAPQRDKDTPVRLYQPRRTQQDS